MKEDLSETCAVCALLDGGAYDAVPEYTCRYTKAMLKALEEAVGWMGIAYEETAIS